jgi:hypothetical protein
MAGHPGSECVWTARRAARGLSRPARHPADRLNALLVGLAVADRQQPSPYPGWTVLGLCCHLPGDELGAAGPAPRRPLRRCRRPRAPAPFGLTGRELGVPRLVAAGRTNAQIGAALYMSPRASRRKMT